MKKLFVLAVVLFSGINVAFADGFSGWTRITRIAAHDFNEVILLYVETPSVTNPKPYCAKNYAVAISKSHPNFKEMYDVAKMAFVLQKPVYGWMHDCYRATSPHFGFPYVIRLDISR